jgi:two-component system, cell cycle sensor histidine kinase and response regulator CckA
MTASLALDTASTEGRVRDALATGSPLELLKVLVEAFPGSWFFTRMDGTFAFVNQRACDRLGYTRDELMALKVFDIDPGLTPELWESLDTSSHFKPRSIRTAHRRKDGSVLPVEIFASRIVVGDERLSVSHVVDLSEEAHARESLAEKERLLQSLLDNAPVVVWYLDADGRFQLSEGSALFLVGLVPGQVVGMTVKEVFPNQPDILKATAHALKGIPSEGVFSVDNAEFEYRYLPRRDDSGKVIGATGVAVDVTARRCAERAKQRLTTAFEQAEDALGLLDSEGRIEYVNAAFKRLPGIRGDDVVGRQWLDLLPSLGASEKARADLEPAIREGAAWSGLVKSARGSEDEQVFQLTLSPFRDRGGKLTGFVAESRDITTQTRTEERLREVEKMDAIGQLASGVAHDFNNLLQIVGGNADLCLQSDVPEPVRAMVVEIQEAGKRAASLAKQLLSFSKNVGEPKSVAVDALLDRMLPLLRRLLGEHVLVEVAPHEGGLDVWGDESQLEQILVNLCVNARDAMPQGGRLTVQLSRYSVDVDELDILGLSTPGAYVALEVTDTGCGMSDEVRRRVFEPFFTTKVQGGGTGLGLATVYAAAKRHGGSVEVWSQVGKGTRFRVLLRQSDQASESLRSHASGRSAPKTGSRLRVLLVENDPSVRKVTQRFLALAGHDVVEVGDGQEAVSLIKLAAATFDLVVLDAIVPHVNGPEVYKTFRSLSTAPVLFVTGHDFSVLGDLPHDRARALLLKPFGASEFADAIAKLTRG